MRKPAMIGFYKVTLGWNDNGTSYVISSELLCTRGVGVNEEIANVVRWWEVTRVEVFGEDNFAQQHESPSMCWSYEPHAYKCDNAVGLAIMALDAGGMPL